MKNYLLLTSLLLLAACQSNNPADNSADSAKAVSVAPGAPGSPPVWAYSGKTGVGSSYEAYSDGAYQSAASTGEVSKVWFSLADGIITETMYGLIHQAQIKDLQLVMVGKDFVDTEQDDMRHAISYLHTDEAGRPQSPAYRMINTDLQDKYQIEKHVFTDPDQQSLMVRFIFTAKEAGITPHLVVNPHINNDGSGDRAWVDSQGLYAEDSGVNLSIKSSDVLLQQSAGFVGVSDGVTDLVDGKLDWQYASTGESRGNVALTAGFETLKAGESKTIDIVLGFGDSAEASSAAANASLKAGYSAVSANYLGTGDYVGWQDYLASLSNLSSMAEMATDGGALAYSSALVLKVQEDKTHAGALIASLSNPWGDTVSAAKQATGYKAVWPRDFYQCAMALLALGDTQTPKVAFEYLKQVQVSENTLGNKGVTGWFLQKTHVDGELEWVAAQLDQTGMPIMLGWQLWQRGALSDEAIKDWYQSMLKPAADFLVNGGEANIGWNNKTVIPPRTQQERWEEQEGYSPSSTAAVIAGLITAAEIAEHSGDPKSAQLYRLTADKYSAQIESSMFTTTGKHNHNGQYYLRISRNQDPNDNGALEDRNGRGEILEKDVLDAGFLELVRYGVRAAKDKYVVDSLEELDDTTLVDPLRVKYEFSFGNDKTVYPGWRRYGLDGYGEDFVTGINYGASSGVAGGMSPNQRGRVWPFFTGERAHYELAAGTSVDTLRKTHVAAMEHFANEGLMLPEQVWDGVGVNLQNRYTKGEGTNSATPLAWTHAEYLKLLKSLSDQQVWDFYPPVAERYQK